MMDLFDKQVTLRMGQCNVKKWVADILPLVEDSADPLGVLDLTTHSVPIDGGTQGVQDVPGKGGRLHQGRPQALTAVLFLGAPLGGICSPGRNPPARTIRLPGGSAAAQDQRAGDGRRYRRRRRWSGPPVGSPARSPPPRPCWPRAGHRPRRPPITSSGEGRITTTAPCSSCRPPRILTTATSGVEPGSADQPGHGLRTRHHHRTDRGRGDRPHSRPNPRAGRGAAAAGRMRAPPADTAAGPGGHDGEWIHQRSFGHDVAFLVPAQAGRLCRVESTGQYPNVARSTRSETR